MPETPIILVGGGGHGVSCIDVIEQEGRFRIAGVVDRDAARAGTNILGYPVLGGDEELAALRATAEHAIITVGLIKSAAGRVALYERLMNLGFTLPVIIAPTALVSPHAEVGAGTIVMHHGVVNAGAVVGVNCILNTKSLIEHDARIGAHTHVSTAAVVNGGATVGERCFVGSNATIVDGIELPDDCFVPAARLARSRRDTRPMQHEIVSGDGHA